jgi:hypothetical protein
MMMMIKMLRMMRIRYIRILIAGIRFNLLCWKFSR